MIVVTPVDRSSFEKEAEITVLKSLQTGEMTVRVRNFLLTCGSLGEGRAG